MKNKMKKILTIFSVILMTTICGFCQVLKPKKCSITATVKDDLGKLIPDAQLIGSNEVISSLAPIPQTEYQSASVLTDIRGEGTLVLKRYNNFPQGIVTDKDGHYRTVTNIDWSKSTPTNQIGFANVILKRKVNPIPMHVATYGGSRAIKITVLNKDLGFDAQIDDFVPPYGKGEFADLVIHASASSPTELSVSIRSGSGDNGIKFFSNTYREHRRDLASDYMAPQDGYEKEFVVKYDYNNFNTYHTQHRDSNFYFRCRPQKNDKGDEVWHYGKIYGPLKIDSLGFEGLVHYLHIGNIYFNPNLGDRNIEFDGKNNLTPNQLQVIRP
jgi:hypothetical protein